MIKYKKIPSLNEFLESLVETYYQGADVVPHAYRYLDKSDRMSVLGEKALSEYASVKELIGTLTISNQGTEDPIVTALKSSGNSKYLEKIKASKGNVTKTANYKDIQELIKFSRMTNSQISNPTDGQVLYLDYLTVIEKTYEHLNSHASLFEKAIKVEDNSKDDFKLITDFYVRIVGLAEIIFDILYSSSIKANIDYNKKVPTVVSVTFECDGNMIEDQIILLQYFNTMASSGRLRDLLNKNVQDKMEDSMEQLKHENVLDVAFSLVSSSKWFDAIVLFPMYVIRYATYLFKYVWASYNAIDVSFKKSLEVSKNNVTATEFNKYKAESKKRETTLDQSAKKATIESEDDMKDTRGTLMAKSGNTNMLI